MNRRRSDETKSPYARAYRLLQERKGARKSGSVDPPRQALIPACYQVLILEGLSKLKDIPEEESVTLASYLKTCQDPSQGVFRDPLGAGTVTDSGLDYYCTCLALHALDALGEKAMHPLTFMDEVTRGVSLGAQADTWDWSRIEVQGRRLMCLLTFLVYRAEAEGDVWARTCFHDILDWLDQRQEEKSGLWNMGHDVALWQSVVLAARLVPFYEYVRRPLARKAKAVDTLLSLSPLDVSNAGPDSCLAAISLLAMLSNQTSYRSDAIKRNLLDIHDAIRSLDEKEGVIPTDRIEEESIARRFSFEESVWARLVTLATIERTLPEEFSETGNWQFRCWPAVGYFPGYGNLSEREKEALPLWIRRTRRANMSSLSGAPAISVVIPCYNLGRYLHEAVESVLAQTFQDFEVIIVDDGSTEEFTRLALSRFERPKTRIVHQGNQGLAGARNAGISQSRGRYICCLDADDRLRPEFFAKAFAILENQADVGLVSGYFAMFDERDGVFQYGSCKLPDLLVYNQAIEPALFRRQGWEKAGGYCQTFSASGIEDWDLWISLLELGYRAEVVPEIVWEYRISFDQMSTRMYQPETWGQLIRQLIDRHRDTYRSYWVDIVATHAVRWTELRSWTNDREQAMRWWEMQAGNWRRLAKERERLLRDTQAWIDHLEKSSLEGLVQNRDQMLQDSDQRGREMEQAKQWSEQERDNWQRLAEERERLIKEQQAWMKELEQAKTWLEEQRDNWEQLARERERMIQEQQAWIAELERAKSWLENQATVLERRIEEQKSEGKMSQAEPDKAHKGS
jgi:glycosyltransferase involved in cell wall biosynthesis